MATQRKQKSSSDSHSGLVTVMALVALIPVLMLGFISGLIPASPLIWLPIALILSLVLGRALSQMADRRLDS